MAVGDMADDRLQQGAGNLEGQRDHPDLHEIECVGILDDRVDGGDQRLHEVVEQMRQAKNQKHGHMGAGSGDGRGKADAHGGGFRGHSRLGKGGGGRLCGKIRPE